MNQELQLTLGEFVRTLDEVEVLLTTAETCVSDEMKYAAFVKSALLLLCGKFENFAELIAEEYVFLVNNLNLHSNVIPSILRLHHTYSVLEKIEHCKNLGQTAEVIQMLNEIGSMWVSDAVFGDLEIECKFKYGKHGDKELRRLFAMIGIDDVFEWVKVYLPDESITGENQVKQVDFKGVFNSVTHLRNNILHQDASPGLTHDAIREHRLVFQCFATELATLLDSQLNTILMKV